MGILWEIVIPTCGNPMGIPTEILWEWDGNGNENSLPTATLISSLVTCPGRSYVLYGALDSVQLSSPLSSPLSIRNYKYVSWLE